MTIDGVDFYKRNPKLSGYSQCSPYTLNVFNYSSDTLLAVINAENISIPPNQGYGHDSCFGCIASYSDNKGNGYNNYSIVECNEYIEID